MLTSTVPMKMEKTAQSVRSGQSSVLNVQPAKVKASRQGVICMWHGLGLAAG